VARSGRSNVKGLGFDDVVLVAHATTPTWRSGAR
jgi:hypothetical protein